MAGGTTAVLYWACAVDWYAVGSPCRSGMAGRTFECHANLGEVADGRGCPLMDGKPSNGMTGRAATARKLAGG